MENYFNNWSKVIDFRVLLPIINKVDKINPSIICPNKELIFKSFLKCDYDNLKVVMLGMEPYPQKDVATGLLFANKIGTNIHTISPSLFKLLNSNFEISPTFNFTLENWADQGVLLLNSALTTIVNEIGAHTMLWRPFISSLLTNISTYNPSMIYVLFGKQAQSFEPYIKYTPHILKYQHPAYAARNKIPYQCDVFDKINLILKHNNNLKILWN